MKWTHLENDLKVAKWTGKGDVRGFSLRGYNTSADLIDFNPVTGEDIKTSTWFVFAKRNTGVHYESL
jgi:hypothetical protein